MLPPPPPQPANRDAETDAAAKASRDFKRVAEEYIRDPWALHTLHVWGHLGSAWVVWCMRTGEDMFRVISTRGVMCFTIDTLNRWPLLGRRLNVGPPVSGVLQLFGYKLSNIRRYLFVDPNPQA